MTHRFLLLGVLMMNLTVTAQRKDTWFAFLNKDSTLVGFRNSAGKVVVKPSIAGFVGEKFDDLIAVMDTSRDEHHHYYLLKNSRQIGHDSLYFFDNTTDCESEGFIRFRDRLTDKVGVFNRHGNIVVPAIYNDMERARNGLIIAIYGAIKKSHGEHAGWSGGKNVLIDTANNLLVDSFRYDRNINLYSIKVSAKPDRDTTRDNFKMPDGKYLSFINFEKEFKAWLKNDFLPGLNKAQLIKHTDDKIRFWKDSIGWVGESKHSFISRNVDLLKKILSELNSKDCHYNIFYDGLGYSDYTSVSAAYDDKYFDNCGASRDWQYPVENVVISYGNKQELIQNHFDFLRTDKGYKLVCISISTGKIKY